MDLDWVQSAPMTACSHSDYDRPIKIRWFIF